MRHIILEGFSPPHREWCRPEGPGGPGRGSNWQVRPHHLVLLRQILPETSAGSFSDASIAWVAVSQIGWLHFHLLLCQSQRLPGREDEETRRVSVLSNYSLALIFIVLAAYIYQHMERLSARTIGPSIHTKDHMVIVKFMFVLKLFCFCAPSCPESLAHFIDVSAMCLA